MNILSLLSPAPLPRRVRAMAGPALLAGLVLATGLHDAAAQGDATAKSSGKEYVLTKVSSFNAPPSGTRNPFWPIGWTPGPVIAATAAAPVYSVKPEDFTLTTTSVDYPPLAIINGRSYAVGDAVPAAGGADTVKVKSIQDGVVLLDHHGRELRVISSIGLRNKK